ncbi:hypothetical protein B0H17DRAFT_1202430 [Mycena rosella]|uniref:Uncharacterized protein n=1 Tax=Mycena rosella TaxID=1033263 RepID=A0AAD7GHJ0_MYCRO|nr:hypothetical protein B0H17DRAFT_1202430 [Mycena rosella]
MATNSPRGVYPGVPTPMRAITTPLRSSAAPPIPPASQPYVWPWAGGVLPVLLLRKAYLTGTAASPAPLVQKSLAPPLRARTHRRTSSPRSAFSR